MDVKVLATQSFLRSLEERVKTRREGFGINPERYNSFRDVFGAKNYGFVLAGDVLKESRTNEKSPVYLFGDDLYPYEAEERGISCRLFLASSFSNKEGIFPTTKEVNEIYEYLESEKNKRNIENILNSRRGTLAQDKKSILELQSAGFKVPESHNFSDFNSLKDFICSQEKKYILKHVQGEEGKQLYRIDRDNLSYFQDFDIEDYIVQEELDILNEKRLIFFDGEFLASRIIHDRHMPWEERGRSGRGHITERYFPTKDEIEESRGIMDYFDAELGCIDWVEDRDKGRLYLEFNGVGTGFGKGERPYNLNRLIPLKLKEKYLQDG